MAFEPDTVFGRYEIESLIALGGMGEVYRARDHELDRSVALKFLPGIHHESRSFEAVVQEARAAEMLIIKEVKTAHAGHPEGWSSWT